MANALEFGDALAEVARRLRASTVRVADARANGFGSGVVWDARGAIVSNAHVVRGPYAEITFSDGRWARARLIRRDADRDLALLRLDDPGGLVPVEIRNAGTLVPGELVVAVGNPLGLRGAMTAGLVQRCNSRWVVADVNLAPGNSGGPLADAWGRLVGINSMVAYGRALAIPSEAVAAFVAAEGSRAA